jgi:hypothetical protein
MTERKMTLELTKDDVEALINRDISDSDWSALVDNFGDEALTDAQLDGITEWTISFLATPVIHIDLRDDNDTWQDSRIPEAFWWTGGGRDHWDKD